MRKTDEELYNKIVDSPDRWSKDHYEYIKMLDDQFINSPSSIRIDTAAYNDMCSQENYATDPRHTLLFEGTICHDDWKEYI